MEDLFIGDNAVLKSPTMTVLLLNSPLIVRKDFLYIFRCSYVKCIFVYTGYILLLNWSLWYFEVTFFVSCYSLCFEVYFVRCKYSYHRFFVCLFVCFHVHGKYFSLSTCMNLLFWGGCLVDSIYMGDVFLSIYLPCVFWLEHLSHLRLLLIYTCKSLWPEVFLLRTQLTALGELLCRWLNSLSLLLPWKFYVCL